MFVRKHSFVFCLFIAAALFVVDATNNLEPESDLDEDGNKIILSARESEYMYLRDRGPPPGYLRCAKRKDKCCVKNRKCCYLDKYCCDSFYQKTLSVLC